MLSKSTAIKSSDNFISNVLLDNNTIFPTGTDLKSSTIPSYATFQDDNAAVLSLSTSTELSFYKGNTLKQRKTLEVDVGRILFCDKETIAVIKLNEFHSSSIELYNNEKLEMISHTGPLDWLQSEKLLYDCKLITKPTNGSYLMYDMLRNPTSSIDLGNTGALAYRGGMCLSACKMTAVEHSFHRGAKFVSIENGKISHKRIGIIPNNCPWSFSPHEEKMAVDIRTGDPFIQAMYTVFFNSRREVRIGIIKHGDGLAQVRQTFHTTPIHAFGQQSILLSLNGMFLVL